MISSTRVMWKATDLAAVAVVAWMSLAGRPAYAQAEDDPVAVPSGVVSPIRSGTLVGDARIAEQPIVWPTPRLSTEPTTGPGMNFRYSFDTFNGASAGVANTSLGPAFQASPAGRRRSIGRKVLGAAIGTVGGFFAGGFLGAKIEGTGCNCDDPGLKGFLIGAPIGAVAGGILGAKFF